MHRLGTDGAVPQLLEARLLARSSGALVALLAENRPEGVEDASAGTERHDGELVFGGLQRAKVKM